MVITFGMLLASKADNSSGVVTGTELVTIVPLTTVIERPVWTDAADADMAGNALAAMTAKPISALILRFM
jgi:hypothetical protein